MRSDCRCHAGSGAEVALHPSHHGYKLSINVDKRCKVIRKIKTGTASKHADKGYPSAAQEAELKRAGYRKRSEPDETPAA